MGEVGRLSHGSGTRKLARDRGGRRTGLHRLCIDDFGRGLMTRLGGACVISRGKGGGGIRGGGG